MFVERISIRFFVERISIRFFVERISIRSNGINSVLLTGRVKPLRQLAADRTLGNFHGDRLSVEEDPYQ